MPRKSQSRPSGYIFVIRETTRCNSVKIAIYGGAPVTPFSGFDTFTRTPVNPLTAAYYHIQTQINRPPTALNPPSSPGERVSVAVFNPSSPIERVSATVFDPYAADKKRDESYRALVAYVKTMCMHADSNIRAAAERIKIVLDTYSDILKKSYEAETSAIYNLVQDLTSEKYAAAVTAIGATQWVSRLSTDNNTFSTLMTARDNETAAKTHINVRAARKAVDEVYRSIVLLVNAHARVNATPAIKAFITKMNIIVKRFNTLLKQHHSHHHHQHGHGGGGEGGAEA